MAALPVQTVEPVADIKATALPVIASNLPVEQGGDPSIQRKGPLVALPDSIVAEASGVPALNAPVPAPKPGSKADIAMREASQMQASAPATAMPETQRTDAPVLSPEALAAVAGGGFNAPVPVPHPRRVASADPAMMAAAAGAAAPMASAKAGKTPGPADADLLTGSVSRPSGGSSGQDSRGAENVGPAMSVNEVVGKAVADHPEIGIARSRVDEANAGVKVARSTYFPQLQTRFTMGQGTPIENSDAGVVKAGSSISSTKSGDILMRQQLLDFGATKNEILKSKQMTEAQKYRLLDKIEEIALKTVQAYLKVLEQRELLLLANANVSAHENFSRLVQASQQAGNGTAADVSRVAAKLVDVQTVRTQLDSDLQVARDNFRRLVRMDPGKLSRPPMPPKSLVPESPETALNILPSTNQSLLALDAARKATKAEMAVQRAAYMPRANFEVQGNLQEYLEPVNKSNWDMRAQVVLTHKLFDGGARRGQMEQINSKLTQAELSYVNTKDELEANIRQSFRALDAARRKLATIREGVGSSRKVKELYIEQFRAGKRTVFELLDSQTSLYNAEKELISNQFDELRATYGLLRSMGRLGESLLSGRS